jgi:23S rRNA pseudouridine1911/1915/1917 synthase
MENSPVVIYEDDYILALNKPSGMDVETLQAWVKNNFNFAISNSFELRNGLVHRLDKPTSGVILFAKSEEVFYALQKQFADRTTEKVYVALVHGKVTPEEGTIDAPIGRLPWKRINFGVIESGREALTNYKVIASNGEYSLLELYPKTGRTHQLRVHLKHIGNPIVGDQKYAPRKIAKADLQKLGRLMLHAKSIKFTHPITKKEMVLEAPLPNDLKLPQ